MLFCDDCDRAYHFQCCDPVIIKPPKGAVINVQNKDWGEGGGYTGLHCVLGWLVGGLSIVSVNTSNYAAC